MIIQTRRSGRAYSHCTYLEGFARKGLIHGRTLYLISSGITLRRLPYLFHKRIRPFIIPDRRIEIIFFLAVKAKVDLLFVYSDILPLSDHFRSSEVVDKERTRHRAIPSIWSIHFRETLLYSFALALPYEGDRSVTYKTDDHEDLAKS
ncbi:hypothetical protein ACLOJK_019430, partial [Asimina triloba]